jgi:hypothetical protein
MVHEAKPAGTIDPSAPGLLFLVSRVYYSEASLGETSRIRPKIAAVFVIVYSGADFGVQANKNMSRGGAAR